MTLADITTVLKNPSAIASYSLEAINTLARQNPNVPQIKAILLRKRMATGAEFDVDFMETNYCYGNASRFIADVLPIDEKESNRFIAELEEKAISDKEIKSEDASTDSFTKPTIIAATSIAAASMIDQGIGSKNTEERAEQQSEEKEEDTAKDTTVDLEDNNIEPTDNLESDATENLIASNENVIKRDNHSITEEKVTKEISSNLLDRIEASPYASWLLTLKQQVPTAAAKNEENDTDEIAKEELNNPELVDQNEPAETSTGAKKADESSILKQEIASQSLAELLAKQGHHKKAIGMYEKLSLIFPEKRAYFAAQIKKIKGI